MTSISLSLRPSSKGGEYKGSLFLRLIHGRRVKNITLRGCRLFREEWDKAAQTVIYPKNNPKRAKELECIELTIKNALETVNRYITQLQSKGRYTTDDLLRLFREKKDDGKLLGFTGILAEGLESGRRHRTAQAHLTAARALVRYNNGVDIPLEHINPVLIKGFEKYLKDEGKMPNTVAYYMRNLRSIYNKAIKSGSIVGRRDEKPFAGVSTAVAKTMKRALPLEDLQALHSLKLHKLPIAGGGREWRPAYRQNLHRSWLYFFFCLFARGMSWVDLAYLRKENIRNGVMRYCRKKTGQQIEISLTSELKAIICSFSSETAGSPYVFPIIRNNGKNAVNQYESSMRTQNNRLKKLAQLAGIGRNISTHVARHSWASVGKEENLPVKVISEGLGHVSQETTLIYLALLNNQALDEANERVENAVKRYFAVL